MNWNYVLLIGTLQVIGLINLYSAAYSTEHLKRIFYSQFYWILIGWLFFCLIYRLRHQLFLKHSNFFYFLNLIALIAVLLIGKQIYGSRRWLNLIFFNYQPSETMKVFLILFMAHFLGRHKFENFGIKELIQPTLILILPFSLTVRQPDLGTALLLLMIPSSVILFLKVKKSLLIGLLACSTVIGYGAWDHFLKPYQKERVKSFLNPGQDPQGSGYNSIQAKIAIGSGKLLGRVFKRTSKSVGFSP